MKLTSATIGSIQLALITQIKCLKIQTNTLNHLKMRNIIKMLRKILETEWSVNDEKKSGRIRKNCICLFWPA